MHIYLVGGAVRDGLLGIPVQERDYVVVGADAAELQALDWRQLNPAFPVFCHPETGFEYALARRERKTGIGYKGFIVETGRDVTLEEDLARRDLTINAIAQDAAGRIFDPFGGIADLRAGKLRHITSAFKDDPVRLLRIARFAAKFGHLQFRIDSETSELLRSMATANEMVSLLPQRFYTELLKALATNSPWCFFATLQQCDALSVLFPELATAMLTGNANHWQDAPVIAALQRAVAATQNIQIRFTALLANLVPDTRAAVALCRRLTVERNVIDLLTLALDWPASKIAQAPPQTLLKFLEQCRLFQQPQNADPLSQLWSILDPATGALAQARIKTALQTTATLSIKTLQAQGLVGAALGAELHRLRLLALTR